MIPATKELLSFLAFRDVDAEVKGLEEVPKTDWPNVLAVFTLYRLMLLMWVLMLFFVVAAIWKLKKGTLAKSPWLLKGLVFSVLTPQIANQSGWMSAEMGRYPWIVQDLLRISEGLSKSVVASQVLGSMIMFLVVYLFEVVISPLNLIT